MMNLMVLQLFLQIFMGNSALQEKTHQKVKICKQQLKEAELIVESSITADQSISQDLRNRVLSATAEHLVFMLNKGEVNSVRIVLILASQSLKANKKLNFITEINFEEAIDIAVQCDTSRKVYKKRNWTIGDEWDMDQFFPPFFGIPITVKDYIKMKGFVSTFGLQSRVNEIQPKDGPIITCLRNSGMIPFYRTNMPQLGMKFQTINKIWGRTLNPWNIDRTPGGSSGGESAAISSRSSVIGIGTDTGGSTRIPAQFCGLFSIKGKGSRIPLDSLIAPLKGLRGSNNLGSAIGPMARSVNDLAIWLRVATEERFYQDSHDPSTKIHPLSMEKYVFSQTNRKIKIGVIPKLEILEPTQASSRAFAMAKDVLSEKGYQLVEISFPNEKQLISHFISEAAAQGNLRSFKEALKGQPFVEEYSNVELSQSWKAPFIRLLVRLFSPRLSIVIDNSTGKQSIYDYLVHGGQIESYRKQWVNFLRSQDLDLILFPGFGCQSFRHGDSDTTSLAVSYHFIWNLLDVTVGTQPITVVQPSEQEYKSKYQDMLTRKLNQIAKGSVGMPVGIQVVGLPFQEEKVLGVMKVIQDGIRFYESYSLPEL